MFYSISSARNCNSSGPLRVRVLQDPFPIGEIFIGHEQEGYSVHVGVARSPTRSGSKADVSSLDAGAGLVLTPVGDRQSSESLSTNSNRRPSTTDLQASDLLFVEITDTTRDTVARVQSVSQFCTLYI